MTEVCGDASCHSVTVQSHKREDSLTQPQAMQAQSLHASFVNIIMTFQGHIYILHLHFTDVPISSECSTFQWFSMISIIFAC